MDNGTLALVLSILFALILAGALIYLYVTKRITLTGISSIAEVLERVRQLVPEDSMVSKLTSYAWKAVYAVEQLVKSGQLEDKTDEARKAKAVELVELFASVDGLMLTEKETAAVETLIEAEVSTLPPTKPQKLGE